MTSRPDLIIVAAAAVAILLPANSGFAQSDADESVRGTLESLLPEELDLSPSLLDAITQLTCEMGGAIRAGDTRVVWLLDRSATLQQRRETIGQAIPAMLQAAHRIGSYELETAVVGYGSNSVVLLPLQPTHSGDSLERLASAFRHVPADNTGIENTFSALIRSTETFVGTEGNRSDGNVLFFVITDEPGDDPERLDEAIAKLNSCGVRCLVVGHVTPFLSSRRYVPWTYGDGFTEDICIGSGLETAFPQRVFRLPLSSVDQHEIPSGFGPWPLSRLTAATGGRYLADYSEYKVRFRDSDLESYVPDTSRRLEVLEGDIADGSARRTLVHAVRTAHRASWSDPPRRFTPDDDRPLNVLLRDAQRAAAVAEYHVLEVRERLETLVGKRDRFTAARWQADFELSLARVRAARLRLQTYNFEIVRMQSEPMPLGPGKDTWLLVPSLADARGPDFEGKTERVENDLQRVIDDHPGTPWAAAAERELSVPWGWTWSQD